MTDLHEIEISIGLIEINSHMSVLKEISRHMRILLNFQEES